MTKIQKNIIKASVILMLLFAIIIIAFLINLGLADTLINSPYNKRLDELRDSTIVGSIYDTNNVLLAGEDDGQRQYNSDITMRNAHSHLIGDTYGYCPTGCEINLASILLDTNEGVFSTVSRLIKDEEHSGDDIQLSVDCRLNIFAYNLMKEYDGALVIQDYTTGEILCMVSTPAFDPTTLIDDLSINMETDAFVNRAIQGQYAPGSLFQIITAGAAIENIDDVQTRSFVCDGTYKVDDEIIYCDTSHGNMSLSKAFAQSCDTVFAELGVELGVNKLNNFAEQLLFNKDFNYPDLVLYPSNISVDKREDDAAFAYAAIGQHEDSISPMHMAMITGAIANDGIMQIPSLLKSVNGNTVAQSRGTRVLFQETAQTLQSYMHSNVFFGSGNIAFSDIFDIYGKEGTAISSTDNSLYPNAWFTGYINDSEHPLVVCVITEQSYVDENVSAIIAKDILEYAYSIGY